MYEKTFGGCSECSDVQASKSGAFQIPVKENDYGVFVKCAHNAKGKRFGNPNGESAFHIYSRALTKKKNKKYSKLIGTDRSVALESYEWTFEQYFSIVN